MKDIFFILRAAYKPNIRLPAWLINAFSSECDSQKGGGGEEDKKESLKNCVCY
jgi:hypothetical protein